MSNIINIFAKPAREPIRSIEILLCFTLMAGGILIMFPQTIQSPTSAIGRNLLGVPYVQLIFGCFYILSSIPGLISNSRWIKHPIKLRLYSTFSLFLIYFFSAILRVLSFGIFPPQWLVILTLSLVAAICHMRLVWESTIK